MQQRSKRGGNPHMIEKWVRLILERELGQSVTLNDDGSAPGMYDLRIGPADSPEMAIECVSALDPVFAETWNVGPAAGCLKGVNKSDWIIVITKQAKVKRIKQCIASLLCELENRGMRDVREDYLLEWNDQELFVRLESLGIMSIHCHNQEGSGKIYLSMPGRGGEVDAQGLSVPTWISEFLQSPPQADVLGKLQRSGAPERHVFVSVEFCGTPWLVESYLTGDLKCIPTAAPDLPSQVTGVWITYLGNCKGIRWDGARWQLFSTLMQSC